MGDFILVSCYVSPRAQREYYLRFLDELSDLISDFSGSYFVIAGDFNARSPTWSCGVSYNFKGTLLDNWAAEKDLRLVNVGAFPTCVNPRGSSIIDLTWVSHNLINYVSGWKVLVNTESLSDHNYIRFSVSDFISVPRDTSATRTRLPCGRSRFNYSRLDNEMLIEALDWYGSHGNRLDIDTVDNRSAHDFASWIDRSVIDSCCLAAPRVGKPTHRTNSYWWSPHLTELRRICNKTKRLLTKFNCRARRRAHASDNNSENARNALVRDYKLARKNLRTAIRTAKLEAWNELLSSVETDIWGRPYLLVLGRLRRAHPDLTERIDTGTFDGLMNSFFPAGDDYIYDRVITGWDEELVVRPAETLCAIYQKRHSNTAPGLDGIRMMVWRKAPRAMVLRLTECFSICFKDGVFPTAWKRANLVLIPKAGSTLNARPIKARPICLLSVTGKIFERVIYSRMLSWMNDHPIARLSDNQYGFRQGRSTCDALLRLRKIVEDTISEGCVAVAVSLDICNAFNSVPFGCIMDALSVKGFPIYIRNIIGDYLCDRVVEFPVLGDRIMDRSVKAGVPQGSVLGPLLWNLSYDEVLNTRLWPGCHALGYADDTLIVAVAGSVEAAGIKATMQTAAVVNRIQRIGLKIAAEKTEAILFHGRRKPSYFPVIRVGSEYIEVGRTLKYLGVIFNSRLNFGDHFSYVAAKASGVARSLGRLMPNLRGPSENKRRLYANVVISVLMYGSPVWHDARTPVSASARRRQAPMLRVQRFIALRVVAAYRSVSLEAASLLACMPPLYLLAGFYRRTYVRIRELTDNNDWTPDADKEVRVAEKLLLHRQWYSHINGAILPGVRIRIAIRPVFFDWIKRSKKLATSFHLTTFDRSRLFFGLFVSDRTGGV